MMLRQFSALACWLIFFSFAVQATGERISTEIKFLPTEDGLIVSYTLATPVTEFRFDHPLNGEAEAARPLRLEDWIPVDEVFTFDGVSLVRSDGAAFDFFTFKVSPDTHDHDRVYPAVYQMGKSAYSIYSRHFLGDTAAFTSSLCYKAESKACEPVSSDTTDLYDGTYILIGGIQPIDVNGMSLFITSEFPKALAERIKASLVANMTQFVEVFGQDAPVKSRIFLDYDVEGSGYRGSVAAGPSMILQLRGPVENLTAETTRNIERFIAHEVVHFWNGDMFLPQEEVQQPWLHEGAADYFAADVAFTSKQMTAHGERWLNGCLSAQGRLPLNGESGISGGQAPYQCGAWIHWLTDKALRQASGGTNDIGVVWQKMFEKASKTDERAYSVEMFQTTIAEVAREIDVWQYIQRLLDGTNTMERISLSADWLSIGLEIEPKKLEDYEGSALRSHMLFSILDQYCKGRRGYNMAPDHVRLDTGDRCGALSGDPIVRSFGGYDLYADTFKAYQYLSKACEIKGNVRLEDNVSNTSVEVACLKPLPPIDTQYAVKPIPN